MKSTCVYGTKLAAGEVFAPVAALRSTDTCNGSQGAGRDQVLGGDSLLTGSPHPSQADNGIPGAARHSTQHRPRLANSLGGEASDHRGTLRKPEGLMQPLY